MASIQKLPSGQYRVQVRRGGIYRAETFATKAEAKDWGAQVESQARAIQTTGYTPPPKTATLADLIDRYVELTKAGGRSKTATLARLREELGKVKLSAYSADVVLRFKEKRIRDGAGGVTIAGDLSTLSAVMHWARDSRRLDVPANIATDVRRSLKGDGISTRSRERTREPSDAELAKLFEHWDNNDRQVIPMSLLVRFALASGMRLGEICRIEVDDVDRATRSITIRDRKDPRHKEGNDQKVPLLPAAWAIVEPMLEGHAGERLFPFNAGSVSTSFTRTCAEVGVADLHFHDLRHRAVASFFAMGLGIPQVALISGHATWAMLKRYTRVKPNDVHEAIARREAEDRNVVRLADHKERANVL